MTGRGNPAVLANGTSALSGTKATRDSLRNGLPLCREKFRGQPGKPHGEIIIRKVEVAKYKGTFDLFYDTYLRASKILEGHLRDHPGIHRVHCQIMEKRKEALDTIYCVVAIINSK